MYLYYNGFTLKLFIERVLSIPWLFNHELNIIIQVHFPEFAFLLFKFLAEIPPFFSRSFIILERN